MSSRKIKKKDIKEDTFITTTLNAWEYIRENQTKFFAGLVVIVIAIVLVSWISRSKREANIAVTDRFSEAMYSYNLGDFKTAEESFTLISNQYGGSREGIYSIYFKGKCSLGNGRNVEAIQEFDQYLEHANKYPFFRDAAMAGKAAALENERNYGEAAQVYLDLANTIITNTYFEKLYLKRAAESFKLDNQTGKAIEVLEKLLELTTGTERRDIEIELAILRS